MKRFNVVIPKDDGGVELYPMKEWLRQNPNQNPTGLDPSSSTSHQLRDALKKVGWSTQETESEVRLIKPGNFGDRTPVEDILGTADSTNEFETAPEASFRLEFQLRDFIAQNLQALSINGQRLRLYIDLTGREGVEFPSPVGFIDILAINGADEFFVFEMKRASSPDHAVGQLARYMGWIKQTIGKGREVHGVIVAKEISDRLRYAVSVIPNVSLFEYEVKFDLRPAHELGHQSTGAPAS